MVPTVGDDGPVGQKGRGQTVGAEHPARRVEETTDVFDRLVGLLEAAVPLETVLARLVQSATVTIPDTASATVTVLGRDGPHTIAASHDWANRLDQHQYTVEDGPCLRAARTGQLVRVDTTTGEHWPEFCHTARRHEVAVAVGVPLLIDEDLLPMAAAMNLTTTHVGAFDPLDEALLELFTHALSTAINHAYRHQQARELVDQLGQALDNRDVIGQAKGLLMARHRCSAEEAFEHLRNASQQANVKLRDVAARLVASEIPAP